MSIRLAAIDSENFAAVCDLDVSDEQQDYVASNMWSLVESHYIPGLTCRAIYHNEQPVGLLMWALECPTKVSIWRFMVDQHYQKMGIGRIALNLALSEIKADKAIKEIEICYQPSNPVAKDFYSSFGFQELGMDSEGDDMLAVIKL